MFAIMKRDFKSYFNSPIAYVIIGLFMLVLGIFFTRNLSYGASDFMGSFVGMMSFLLLFFIPILTMRTVSEDKKNGTEVLLLTSPTKNTEVVLGKFLAAYSVFLIMTAFTFVFPLILMILGKPDVGLIACSYLGFLLYGAVFVAVGVFASSLTENQIVAAVISFVSLLLLYVLELVASYFSGFMNKAILWLSISKRYSDFGQGILDFTSIVFMLSIVAIFIYFTVRIIERKRWSQG